MSIYKNEDELAKSIEYKKERDNSFKFATSTEGKEQIIFDGDRNINVSNITGQVGQQITNMLILLYG